MLHFKCCVIKLMFPFFRICYTGGNAKTHTRARIGQLFFAAKLILPSSY